MQSALNGFCLFVFAFFLFLVKTEPRKRISVNLVPMYYIVTLISSVQSIQQYVLLHYCSYTNL